MVLILYYICGNKKYMNRIVLWVLLLVNINFSFAQKTTDCEKKCEVTKIVETGPLLGVQIINAASKKHAQIIRVLDNTSAQKVGLKVGGVISFVDDIEVKNNYHLVDIIGAHQPGDKVVLTYTLNGKTEKIKVRIGAKKTSFVTEKVCCDDADTKITITNGIALIPNPANEKVTVQTTELFEGNITLSVYNADGKEVIYDTMENKGVFSHKLDISNLAVGKYIVRINNEKENRSAILLIAR